MGSVKLTNAKTWSDDYQHYEHRAVGIVPGVEAALSLSQSESM